MLDSTRIIVTAGSAYTDIDALACGVAYAELLRLLGKHAIAVFEAPLNSTISDSMRSWALTFETKYEAITKDQFVLVDVSDPEYFERFVDRNGVIQVFDHHHGYEVFWQNKLNHNAIIEEVGSCATLIWEQFRKFGKCSQISTLSANLLYCSIVSNTLNFKASITNKRDITAIQELQTYIELPSNWIDIYYSEVEKNILADPINAIKVDTKRLLIQDTEFTIAQLELWNAGKLIQHKNFINSLLNHFESESNYWFLTIANIKDGFNYIVSSSLQMQRIIARATGAEFQKSVGVTDKLFLRKELIKILMNSDLNLK
jgi:inorganic pyrophosphatase/exopolyphosphatase